ncbi:MAG: hypothetical protein ACF8PN_14940 [Phycisphaerales bacterium]
MARFTAFLATGVFVGFIGSLFQIPNFIPIMLLVFWVGMGAGLRIWWGLAGVFVLPFAIAAPMCLLPGPTASGRLEPPNDSRFLEFYRVTGADEIYAELWDEYESVVKPEYEEAYEAGLARKSKRPASPDYWDANRLAIEQRVAADEAEDAYRVWPLPRAFLLGIVVVGLSFVTNTMTTKPFRDPGPLGAE